MAKPDFRLNEPMHHLYIISLNIDIFCYINNSIKVFFLIPTHVPTYLDNDVILLGAICFSRLRRERLN